MSYTQMRCDLPDTKDVNVKLIGSYTQPHYHAVKQHREVRRGANGQRLNIRVTNASN